MRLVVVQRRFPNCTTRETFHRRERMISKIRVQDRVQDKTLLESILYWVRRPFCRDTSAPVAWLADMWAQAAIG
jgi:hypothetical protein